MTNDLFGRQPIACRLVIIDGASKRILMTASGSPHLLRESVSMSARVARALTRKIEEKYGLQTIQLAFLDRNGETEHCAVHELVGVRENDRARFSSCPLDEVPRTELTDRERTLVSSIMRGEAVELGRFAQLGWSKQLLERTASLLDHTGPIAIQQWNQGVDFCLVTLADATGHRIWFKAVGDPNTREFGLTLTLWRLVPKYLPKILAVFPEWNGWVMEHVEGVGLDESCSIDRCEEALTALATIQKETMSEISTLRTEGAQDWSCARVARLAPSFFREAGFAMEAQSNAQSRPLSGGELRQLGEDLRTAVDEFNDAKVPDGLVHGDIGHGNVISTTDGPVFLDWAETYIGHPFLSAEYLLADLARSSPVFAEQQGALRLHYASQWRNFESPTGLQRVAACSAAVAAFTYAVMVWDMNRNRPEPEQAWPLIRSILRRTKRELELTSEALL